MKLSLKVVPGAAQNAIAGWLGETLKVRVTAPPEQGKANRAVEGAIAAALQISLDQVKIIHGHASPRKIVEIHGLEAPEVAARLGKASPLKLD